jgi:hypothetical protein
VARVHALQVIAGIFLGWLGSWFLYTLAILVVSAAFGEANKSVAIAGFVLSFVALFLIPVVTGVTLIRRGRSRLGSGMLLGVAIGSLIGAGVCTSVMFVG